MFNNVTVADIQPKDENVFSLKNKIRNSWMKLAIDTDLMDRINLYIEDETEAEKRARIKLYGAIDEMVRVEYLSVIRENHAAHVEAGNVMHGVSFRGTPVLCPSTKIDLDQFVIDAALNVLTKLDSEYYEFYVSDPEGQVESLVVI